jgi:D-lactate dehydrogenase
MTRGAAPYCGSAATGDFLAKLKFIVGRWHVLTSERATRAFRTGFRYGGGQALVVIQPGSLVELWRVTQACVDADKIIIPQAANTGLTGGSTPMGDDYDRGVVLVSMSRIAGLHLIRGGQQVVCLAGCTLHELEKALKNVNREPHSVIGSSCIGASVIGGICNNSGGSLVRRGPAYTELALFAKLDGGGRLVLVNHLGIKLGSTPEEILERLESGQFAEVGVESPPDRRASDQGYAHRLREVASDVPCRFNADPGRLYEVSGSAGRVIVFAVRLDTLPKDRETRVFYVGTNDPAILTKMRQDILSGFKNLPVAGEYLHRDAFDLAAHYGKDTFLAIRLLGTDRLPQFFRLKALADRVGLPSDRILQGLSRLFPDHLPRRMWTFRARYEHHLLLKMAGEGITEARQYLGETIARNRADYFECTGKESEKAFLHRFATAGAAIRYRTIHAHEVKELVAIDVALRPNDSDWAWELPQHLAAQIKRTVKYAHFFCYVFHFDYLIKTGGDAEAIKAELLELLDARGAEYPAEHNVGHLYRAKTALEAHYRALDPTNSFNPGIGKTSKVRGWC